MALPQSEGRRFESCRARHDFSVTQQTDRILEIKDGRLLRDVRTACLEPELPAEPRSQPEQ